MIREQTAHLLTAFVFYTRLPVSGWVEYSEERQRRSIIYLPVVGWLVGGVAAGVYWGTDWLFSPVVAIVLSTAASVLLTGAFHEDGFADVCDGFGGGWDKARILEIMKDSRVGAYGIIGLILILALKIGLLAELPSLWVMWGLLLGHTLSRTAALTFVYTHPYARPSESSKVKAAARPMSTAELATALLFGMLPLAAAVTLTDQWTLLSLIPCLWAIKWGLGVWFQRKLEGYTGDCLGATQQLCEVAVYVVLAIFVMG